MKLTDDGVIMVGYVTKPDQDIWLLKSLNVFPNPLSDAGKIHISGMQDGKEYQVRIHDVLGKIIMQMPATSDININAALLMPAMYYVNLIENGKILMTRKMIVTN
jgi:hypothetical protein